MTSCSSGPTTAPSPGATIATASLATIPPRSAFRARGGQYGFGRLAGKTVVAIATGDSHSLALCSDGTVAAWGYNLRPAWRQHHDQSPVPVEVNTASGVSALSGKTVVAVAAGGFHSLACARTAPWPPGAATTKARSATKHDASPGAGGGQHGGGCLGALRQDGGGGRGGSRPQPGPVLRRHRGRLGQQLTRPAWRQHPDGPIRAGGGQHGRGRFGPRRKDSGGGGGGRFPQPGPVFGRHRGRLGRQLLRPDWR
jgi:hypothetical protein